MEKKLILKHEALTLGRFLSGPLLLWRKLQKSGTLYYPNRTPNHFYLYLIRPLRVKKELA